MTNFEGFPLSTVTFLTELAKNNKKTWFDAHRKEYYKYVVDPGRSFTEAMGERLTAFAPGIIAEPRINGSIFRIYRDIRFSKDKQPYKTHLGIFMWEGEGPKMECPGFYFHLEPPNLLLGGGIHIFSKPLLEEYRRSVVHPKHGPDLVEAAEQVSRHLNLGGRHYRRTPRGYDPQHPFAEYLLYNGLTGWIEGPVPEALHGQEIIDHCFDVFRKMVPIHKWLLKMVVRANSFRV